MAGSSMNSCKAAAQARLDVMTEEQRSGSSRSTTVRLGRQGCATWPQPRQYPEQDRAIAGGARSSIRARARTSRCDREARASTSSCCRRRPSGSVRGAGPKMSMRRSRVLVAVGRQPTGAAPQHRRLGQGANTWCDRKELPQIFVKKRRTPHARLRGARHQADREERAFLTPSTSRSCAAQGFRPR